MLPVGTILDDVWWESHDGRVRLPRHLQAESRDAGIKGKPGITFGRQIGAYPILVGLNYLAPLETYSQIMVTNHGARSITGIETELDMNSITEKQLSAIPGISAKGAWNLISGRAKAKARGKSFDTLEDWFDSSNVQIPTIVDIGKIIV